MLLTRDEADHHKADVPTPAVSAAGSSWGMASLDPRNVKGEMSERGFGVSPQSPGHITPKEDICSPNGLRVTAGASFRRTSDDSGPETTVLCIGNLSSRNLAVRAVTSSLLPYIVAPANYTLLPGETREVCITPVTQESCEPYSLILEVAAVQGADVLDAEGWSELLASCIDKLILRVASGCIEAMEQPVSHCVQSTASNHVCSPQRHPLSQPLASSLSARLLGVNASHPQTGQTVAAQSAPPAHGASLGPRLTDSLRSHTAAHPSSQLRPPSVGAASCQSLHRSMSTVATHSLQARLSAAGGSASRGCLGGSIGAPVGSPMRHTMPRSFSGSLGAPVGGPVQQHGPAIARMSSGAPDWMRPPGSIRLSSPVARLSAASVSAGFVPGVSIPAASWAAGIVVPSGQQRIQAGTAGARVRSRSTEGCSGSIRPMRSAR